MLAAAALLVPARAPSRRRSAAMLMTVLALLGALALLGVLAVPAAPAHADVRRPALTSAQERVVLGLVDDICGDTWCEGEHAFRFRGFSCHLRRGCVLRVQLASWSHEPLRWHTRTARVAGFPRYRDMVVTAPGGQRSLQPAFYEAVGRAVQVMTASVP